MTRGRFRLAAALALSAAAAAAPQASAAELRRPNIVVLVADDWGFSDVGAFGGEIATPNLDALARRGVRFSNFHVAASCSPTRSMLLTGVDNHRNGVGNLRESMPQEHLGRPGYLGSLDTHVVTVASLLQDSGYRTYVAGKWNVGSEPHNLPPQRGFDRSIVLGDTGSDNWVPSQRYLPHSDRVHWFEDGGEAQMPAEFYSSAYFVDRMIGYLHDGAVGPGADKPFFAYVGFQANHAPLQAPAEFIEKVRGRYDAGWAALRQQRRDRAAALGLIPAAAPMATIATTGDWSALSPRDKAYQARLMEVYAAMAEAMDHHVGRLVAHLQQTGEIENTVFVFLSDNGPEGSDYAEARPWLLSQYSRAFDRLGGKGAYAVMGPSWASAAAAPLSGYKFYAGEGGLRVPLIIAGAPAVAGAAAGGVHTGLTHVNDIVPTLLELARVAHPAAYRGRPVEPLTGRSLLSVLADPAHTLRAEGESIGYELSGNSALFKGGLKLVRNLPPVGDGQWHLHDLRTDPGEARDLRELQPDVSRALQAEYDAWAAAHGVLPMPEGYNPTTQVLINSFVNYWIPTYRAPAGAVAGLLAALAALLFWRRKWRQGRRA